MKRILVVLDVNLEHKLNNININAIAATKYLQNSVDNSSVACLVFNGKDEVFSQIASYGISNIVNINSFSRDKNTSPSHYANAITQIVKDTDCNIVVFPTTVFCGDVAPRVAVKLDADYVSNVIDFKFDDMVIAESFMYGGKLRATIRTKRNINVFSIAPNSFNPIQENIKYVVENKEISLDENSDESYKIIEFKKTKTIQNIADANIVITGGRGLKNAKNFVLLEDLAKKLNAAVGATRSAVDAGWRPHFEQIGQTGKTIAPNLYIAVGASGAIQHIAGMNKSKFIIAINNDKNAPIFEIANVVVIGDLFKILSKLIECNYIDE